MTTRFYYSPQLGMAASADTILNVETSEWDGTGRSQVPQRVGSLLKAPAVFLWSGFDGFGATFTSAGRYRYCSFFSRPLRVDVEISGTVKGQLICGETNSTDNAFAQIAIYVIKPDGSIRGKLLGPQTSGGTEFVQASGTPPATQRNTRFPPAGFGTLSNVSAIAGDRLLVEIGVRSTAAPAQGPGPYITFTRGGADADLPENESTTYASGALNTAPRGWLEFSQDLDMGPEPATHVYTGGLSEPIAGGAGEDVTPPTVTNFSPSPGSSIAPGDSISFDVEDETALVAYFVYVAYASGDTEVVCDGSAFTPRFAAGSSRVDSMNLQQFSIARTGGWTA